MTGISAKTTCGSCGTINDGTDRFCAECGAALARSCPSCGAILRPAAKFCRDCGQSVARLLEDRPVAATATSPATGPGGLPTERRLVSVLFVDLVGFTALAEQTDPEAVRETLDSYFRRVSDVVRRYGGVVEKFIGDAVMAVWGAPTAHEDDAERAVRAALELIDVVRAMPVTVPGTPRLSVRAGVTTGEAAVTVGAAGQGMVTGDIVNTASRLQASAAPDSVVVGEGTYRATHESIAFEPLGDIALKGKAEDVRAWRALRVVAQRRGAGRTDQLEAPFVGREEDLRLLKDMLDATGRERRARLVSVVGQAGIGKSRLAWEFLKYVDGLVEPVYWHQGRSLAYGSGISYWALGEMVRARAGIGEGELVPSAAEKLAAMATEYLPDREERAWVEPRLAALLGLAEAPDGGREELFAAWRTLFQRVAELGTTVLVFEDLQWADQALLDFIDELLDWARSSPILVVTLARPELLDRRPDWGAGRRAFVSITLDPLDRPLMRDLLAGLVPGLPAAAAETIVARADGVPLYAVELVRMLIADGRLESTPGGYRPVGDLADVAVPETLQALVTARLDALDPQDRSLLQAAAVLGTTFSGEALAAISGLSAEALEPRLRTLVRRELLEFDGDPRSPTRGQYGFVQALTHDVAYGNLGRRERRALHLAAARELEALGDDELAGILASHFVAAYRAVPDGPEAEAIMTQARLALRGAATRSAALFAYDNALGYADEALAMTTDPTERAGLNERIAEYARALGRVEVAEARAREALEWYRATDDAGGVARASFRLATIQTETWRVAEAVETLERALAERDLAQPDPDLAPTLAALGRAYMNLGRSDRGLEWTDRAIVMAERIDARRPLVDALITRAWAVDTLGRHHEALAIAYGALYLADRWGFVEEELRARNNIASGLETDRDLTRSLVAGALELARRRGLRNWTDYFESAALSDRSMDGDWDGVLADLGASEPLGPASAVEGARVRAWIHTYRGDFGAARLALEELDSRAAGASKANDLGMNEAIRAQLALAEGRYEEALESARLAALTPENSDAWYLEGLAAYRLRDPVRLRRAAATATSDTSGDLRLAIAETVLGYQALLEGRRAEAAGHFTAGYEAWRRRHDVGYEAFASAGLVAALGEDTAEGRQLAGEVRQGLRVLRADWLLQWLDEVIAMTRRRVAPEAEASRDAEHDPERIAPQRRDA